MVLYSEYEHIVHYNDLTISFEHAIEEAFERKKLKYVELVAEVRERDWQAHTRPVEIGVRGFVAKSTTTLLDFGLIKRTSKGVCLRLLKKQASGCGTSRLLWVVN